MVAVPNSSAPVPRKASREIRRQQLIDATIETLAAKGQARLKLQDVAETAGLSYGLVNFHFQSKENLLAETLMFMAAEYQATWQGALASATDQPAARLDALIQTDFNETVFTPAKIRAWCTFWGEAQSRPIYQELCGAKDREYVEIMEGVCAQLIAQAGLTLNASRVARVLRVTIEGIWLDMLTMSTPYSRDEALRTAYTCAAAFFPRAFTQNGLRTAG